AVARPAQHAGLDQRLGGHRLRDIELAGVGRRLDALQVDLGILAARHVLEAALRQAPEDRHLAAFEAVDRNAGTGRLAFTTATAGLALGRTDAASDADPALASAGIVPEFVELHRSDFPSLVCRRPSLGDFLDGDEMANCLDHAAHGGRVFQLAGAMALVEPETDQRLPLVIRAADRAAGLGDADALLGSGHNAYSLASAS